MSFSDSDITTLIHKNPAMSQWTVWNSDSGYVDIECNVTAYGEPGMDVWHSLFVMVSIDLTQPKYPFFINVGVNIGNGNEEFFCYEEKTGLRRHLDSMTPYEKEYTSYFLLYFHEILAMIFQGQTLGKQLQSFLLEQEKNTDEQ